MGLVEDVEAGAVVAKAVPLVEAEARQAVPQGLQGETALQRVRTRTGLETASSAATWDTTNRC